MMRNKVTVYHTNGSESRYDKVMDWKYGDKSGLLEVTLEGRQMYNGLFQRTRILLVPLSTANKIILECDDV